VLVESFSDFVKIAPREGKEEGEREEREKGGEKKGEGGREERKEERFAAFLSQRHVGRLHHGRAKIFALGRGDNGPAATLITSDRSQIGSLRCLDHVSPAIPTLSPSLTSLAANLSTFSAGSPQRHRYATEVRHGPSFTRLV